MPKESAVKIRVPRGMKAAVKSLADSRTTSESAIFREAVIEYMAARKLPIPPDTALKPVSYRKGKRPPSSSAKKGTGHKIAEIIRSGASGSSPGDVPPPKAKP